jgi:hypothetical protein
VEPGYDAEVSLGPVNPGVAARFSADRLASGPGRAGMAVGLGAGAGLDSVPGVSDEFGTVDVAGSAVVAVSEKLGGTVQLTLRDAAGRERVLAFVEPLAFEVLSLLDVPLSRSSLRTEDPWIGQVCAALDENPAGYQCFVLLDTAGLIRFRMVARDAAWAPAS